MVRFGTDTLGNTTWRVVQDYANSGEVTVQGELDHPNTRRARARRIVAEVLGEGWTVGAYVGCTELTHTDKSGARWGSMHHYVITRNN